MCGNIGIGVDGELPEVSNEFSHWFRDVVSRAQRHKVLELLTFGCFIVMADADPAHKVHGYVIAVGLHSCGWKWGKRTWHKACRAPGYSC